ncbi:hypothetical protein ALC56_08869 [Trachymyrmex septentrionalis]|uniref:Uncharacterized protein n=1 Tax=Trachymyrmex septentrionalis TaxID=34720 RepID=A0A195F9F9_9HYME|nr:hypothetical protein ALC56_08869 [Trachymyrmex septentrionalis]
MQRAARCSCKRSTVKWWGIVAARGRAIPLNGYGATITYLPMRKRGFDIANRAIASHLIYHICIYPTIYSCITDSVSAPEEAYSYSPTTARLHQVLQCICSETSTAAQVPAYLIYTLRLFVSGFSRFPGVSSQSPSRILTNRASLLAVGPARAYSRGKEEKRTKRRNHAESSGSCTYAGSAPDRCRGVSPPLAKASPPPRSLPRAFPPPHPSSLPHAGFLRSEACVRVSPSFPFIAAHSSASPSRVLGVTAFSPASRDRDPKSIRSFFSREGGTLEKNAPLVCQQQVRNKMHSDHTNNQNPDY